MVGLLVGLVYYINMLDSIYQIYTQYILTPYLSLIKELEVKPAGIYVLIAILIILSVAQSRIIKRVPAKAPSSPDAAAEVHAKPKHQINHSHQAWFKVLDKIFTLSCLFVLSLIIGVCYIRFSPAITDFLKTDTPTDTTTQTTTPGTPTQTTTPTYVAPKRLYYYCSCSSCWASGCPRNGYSYGGYDSSYYSYYHSLCQACSCNSLNAGSFWK